MTSILILGTGNLAKQWIISLASLKDYGVVGIVGRTAKSLAPFRSTHETFQYGDQFPEAALSLIAVSDDAIGEVSSLLTGRKGIIAHCSGAVSIHKIVPAGRRAVLYPLQTFSGQGGVSLKDVPICIETENRADLGLLTAFAHGLSGRVEIISSEQRQYLHLAAVFVNNFVTHLYQIGHDILKQQSLDPSLLTPLIEETTSKLKHLSPMAAQTGPAKRGDTETQALHLHLLTNPNYHDIYQQLSKSIQTTYEKLQGET